MGEGAAAGFTRRQFLAGGVTGVAGVWAASKFGWVARADALTVDQLSRGPDVIGALPFVDDFDQEFPGGTLTNWNVGRPVQVVGATSFGILAPASSSLETTTFLTGHGLAVAMDGLAGSGSMPGRIETGQIFLFRSDRTYTLSFEVAGSHRRGDLWAGQLVASLPGCGAQKTVSRRTSDGFRHYNLVFNVKQPAASAIVFESLNAPGMAGLVLDNVSLSEGNGGADGTEA